MRILIFGGFAQSLINFRGPLLISLVERGHEVIACAPDSDEDISARLRTIGVVFQPVTLQRTGTNIFFDLLAIRELIIFFKKLKPDLLLSYTIKPVIYGSIAARLAGVENINSIITGLGSSFACKGWRQILINKLVCYLYRLALSKNKHVFFQNPDDLDLFIESDLANRRQAILLNGSGVDLDYFAPINTQNEKVEFLLVARLVKEKGIVEFVEAARIMKAKYPDVCCSLLGPFDSNPFKLTKDIIDSWENNGLIRYWGATGDVRPYIANSTVFVLPSYYREGTPRSILEAMSMGRPIITTDAPGCRETVIEGENGFLVPIKDPVALARAMERFILQPELIERMGKRSREIAEEKYDVHKVNAVILRAMGLA